MTNHPAPEPAAPASAAPVPATDDVEPPFSARVIDALFAARKQRVDGWSPARVMAFIEMLSETGSVTRAADFVDMSVTSAYRLRARPDCASFAEAWDSALQIRHERLIELAMERTRDGFERTRWYQGEVVGEERIMSDQLLMFMIDRTDPLRHGNGFGAQRLRPAAISATAIAPPRDAAVNASPRDAAEPRDASGLATRC